MGVKKTKLKKWLAKEGRTQVWLARNSKLSETAMSQICSGKREPNVSTVKRIMTAIRKVDKNAKVDDFFDI
ncbi:helix-turn-helix transcriptional regulator [Priestia endophytica]|mgnify:CR=1 FL=1|uniref:helix-turn-helix domain-containing protein n=1 Tax=Priestia TaxID=2800373 RepID=UPI000DCA35D4|nr:MULTISPECIES: helix-turn-helix transcriptional regulator [Priestia]MED3729616.1 helix-turn-helix transcriptional regulator [Priestia filamentosa]RAS87813.1 transcriptional regulator [Priestia endophytica]